MAANPMPPQSNVDISLAARQYVANARYSLGQVAAMLGYSTHSAFTRWFVGQFGCAPEVWRRQARPPG